jgi:hypothetical protein
VCEGYVVVVVVVVGLLEGFLEAVVAGIVLEGGMEYWICVSCYSDDGDRLFASTGREWYLRCS